MPEPCLHMPASPNCWAESLRTCRRRETRSRFRAKTWKIFHVSRCYENAQRSKPIRKRRTFLLKTNLIGQMSPIWHLTLLGLLLSESVGTYDKLNIYAKKIFRVIGTSKQNLSQVRWPRLHRKKNKVSKWCHLHKNKLFVYRALLKHK